MKVLVRGPHSQLPHRSVCTHPLPRPCLICTLVVKLLIHSQLNSTLPPHPPPHTHTPQIVKEKFLVYINDLLSTGYIADLCAPEDRENFIGAVRLAAFIIRIGWREMLG